MKRIWFGLLAAVLFITQASPAGVLMLAKSGGGGCAFPSLPNLVAHWRADQGVSTSSGNITSVAGQDGTSIALTPSGGNVPWSATASAHSQPAFNFVAANGAVLKNTTTLTLGSGTSAMTIAVVGQMASNTQNFGGLIAMIGTPGTNDYDNPAGWTFNRDALTNNVISSNNSANNGDVAVTLGTQYRFMLIFDGAGQQVIYLNNVFSTTTGSALSTGTSNNFLAVGGRLLSGVPSTTNQWEGPVSDIVITNSALTAPQAASLDTYFTCQWGT